MTGSLRSNAVVLPLAVALLAAACAVQPAAGPLGPAGGAAVAAASATAAGTALPTSTSIAVPATTTPQPTQAPTAAPTDAAATDAPTAAPTARPTNPPPRPPTAPPTAPPPPSSGYPGGIANASGTVPPNLQRYSGRVTEAATGLGIAGACVYAGPPSGCPVPNVNTDASGYWAIDFPSGFALTWNVQHPAYTSALGLKATSVQLVRR